MSSPRRLNFYGHFRRGRTLKIAKIRRHLGGKSAETVAKDPWLMARAVDLARLTGRA